MWLYDLFKPSVDLQELDNDSGKDDISVVFIHGANQSSACWNYIREKTNFKNEILIDYSSMNSFYDNLDSMVDQITDQPIFVVGHSLGGIYGLHLINHCDVVGGVSISTPFRGSSAADWAKFVVPGYQLFKDVGRRSRPILDLIDIEISVNWTQIVSTNGNVPYLKSPNDGVCTVESMEHFKDDMDLYYVPATHYEVMCCKQVSDLIVKKYQEVSASLS